MIELALAVAAATLAAGALLAFLVSLLRTVHARLVGLALVCVVLPLSAVLRRMDTAPDAEAALAFGDLRIDPGSRRVHLGEAEIALTQREFDLLLYLARHPGQVFSRNQLMDAVWQYSFYTDTSTVTVHIRRLRSKIEADPARPLHIQTVWGVGYRFQP